MDTVKNLNVRHFGHTEDDHLYHLGLSSSHDLSMFSNVKAVCMSGSNDRARTFATKLMKWHGMEDDPIPIGTTERGHLYLVKDIISMSHGMGQPSCLIFLHEVVKLLRFANADLEKIDFIRIGTSGGIGVPGGTIALTSESLDGTLQPGYVQTSCGVQTRYTAKATESLVADLEKCGEEMKVESTQYGEAYRDLSIAVGKTMCTNDFYEGQARLDGALDPWFSEEQKMDFLKKAYSMGVINIEMESSVFLSFFQRLNLRCAVVCGCILDRLLGDQHSESKETVAGWANRPQDLIMHYLMKSGKCARIKPAASGA